MSLGQYVQNIAFFDGLWSLGLLQLVHTSVRCDITSQGWPPF